MSDMTSNASPDDAATPPLALVDDASTDDDDDEMSTDGRTMRRRRNREAVIDALISLIREGDLNPTVAKIADRAAVSHRSIFRYFDDLSDLARTAIEAEFRNSVGMSALPNIGEGTLEERVDAMIAVTLELFSRTLSLGRVARSRSVDIPEVDHGLNTMMTFRHEQLRRHFDQEFSAMEPDEAEAMLGAVAASISFDTYDQSYRVLERTHDEIARQWRLALLKLLG